MKINQQPRDVWRDLCVNAAVANARMRGKSSWPFGPVGIREERRKPYRANEMAMGQTPRRRWSDCIDDDRR